jgi:Leucine-rich repeat (LRR) protein
LKTPNFEGLCNLQKLILIGCISLVEIDDTIGDLKRLIMLNLKNCRSLRKFPKIFMSTSLETLIVDGCTNIFHVSMEVVGFSRVRINLLPFTSVSHLKAWCTFFQQWLSKPSILDNPRHLSVSFPRYLTSLSLQDCNLGNDDFQLDLNQLSMLEELDLSFNHFHNLPRCIGSLCKLKKLSLISCTKLAQISNLPNVYFLDVDNCSSLKSITYLKTNFSRPFASFNSCSNLREFQGMFKIEPLYKVDSEILDNLALRGPENMGRLKLNYIFRDFYLFNGIGGNTRQGLYEFGIFSTYLAQEEAPSWCVDGSNNGTLSSVSLVVPSHPNLVILGLNVYSSYTLSRDYPNGHTTIKDDCLLFIKLNNKTKDLCWMYSPVLIATSLHKNDEGQPLVWLSHWKFSKSHLEVGDEIDVSVIAADAFLVKAFGINLVWGEKDKESTVARDLSFFEIMNGTFFLTLRYEVVLLSPGNWVLKLFEDRAECEDYKEWLQGTGKDSEFYDDLDF